MTGYDPTAYRDYFEHEFTYLNGFRRNIHRYAERVALRDPDRGLTLTYGELGKRVDRLATGLRDAGVRPGDVVVYQLYNSTGFAELYLATQICGAIGSPINYRLAPGEVAYVLDDSEPVAFVYDATLHDAARTALDTANHRPSLVAAVGGETAGGEPAGETAAPDVPRFSELYATTTSTLPGTESVYQETTRLYTSGTTGMPKGVPLNSLVEVLTAHDVIMQLPLTRKTAR